MTRLVPWMMAVAVTFAGCSATPEADPLSLLARPVQPVPVALDSYPVPEELGAFRLQGNIESDAERTRLMRYINDAGQTLEFTLYPIPGGWDSYTPEQMIGGHYGQVRQQQSDRLARRGATRVMVAGEKLLPARNGSYPIAETLLKADFEQRESAQQLLLLTAMQPVFVRLVLEPASDADRAPANAALDSLMAILEGAQKSD